MMNILVKSGVSPRIFLLLMGCFVMCDAKIPTSIETVITSKELDARGLECVTHCLASSRRNTINICYDNCNSLQEETEREKLAKRRRLYRRINTYDIGLICRDDTSFLLKMNITFSKFPEYMVIQFIATDGEHKNIFLTTTPEALLYSLEPGKVYNITGWGFKGEMFEINEEFRLNEMIIATLKSDTRAQDPTDIKVFNYKTRHGCNSCLYAYVEWTPSADNTCFFHVAWHDNEMGDLQDQALMVQLELPPQYFTVIGELKYGQEYKIAVRNFMHDDHFTNVVMNDFNWQTFVTPQCSEFLTKHEDILDECAPLQPTYVEAMDRRIDKDKYDIEITWMKPKLPLPHHYTITIRNLDHNAPFSIVMDVEGDKTQAKFEGLKITGIIYEATVEAVFPNGKRSSTTVEKRFGIYEESSELGAIALYIVIAVLIILGIIIFVVWKYRIINSKIQVQMHQGEPNGSPRIEMRQYRTVDDEEEAAEEDIPYINDNFEVDRDDVTIMERVGEGHFGTVNKGILTTTHVDIPVAIKKMKSSPTSEDIRKFIQEINIMKSVPQHRNIVSILGHCTNKKATMLLITEYCSKGSLLNYLRSEWKAHKTQQACWSEFSDHFVNYNDDSIKKSDSDKKMSITIRPETGDFCSVHVNAVENPTYSEDCTDDFVLVDETHLTMKSLLDIGLQVAEGMKFLALNKVVHRDLAARNVLVNHENVVKIADFGLSRDIYEDGMYWKSSEGRVPIKWMALEALSRQVYSTQSDVWSFGVLLYEIITLGCIPYPTVQNDQLLVYLMSGSRMEKPTNCSHTLYKLMISCWLENPSLRPTFESIIQQLTDEKENLVDDEVVDLDKLEQDGNLIRDALGTNSTYLTPICGRPPYVRLQDSSRFPSRSPK